METELEFSKDWKGIIHASEIGASSTLCGDDNSDMSETDGPVSTCHLCLAEEEAYEDE